jgi:hypothetical protein
MNKTPRPKLLAALVGNWVGIFGLVLAMGSLFVALCLIGIDFLAGFRQPYMGILVYLIVPSFFWMASFAREWEYGWNAAGAQNRRRLRPTLRQVARAERASLSQGLPALSLLLCSVRWEATGPFR